MLGVSDEFVGKIEEVKGRLYRIAYLYLGDQALAVDAVDEAVYLAYRNYWKLRNKEYFNTWITRILINVCKKELKRRKRVEVKEQVPELGYEEYDSLPLREAISKLPDDLRIIITLRYFNGFTVVETANILHIPQGTVATRQRKALSLLKLELGAE